MRKALIALIVLLAAATCRADANISLDLSNVDILDAFTSISRAGGVTILGDPTVKGRVSCNLTNVTVDIALNVICKTNGLVWIKTYTAANGAEKIVPSKVFARFDALKGLDTTPIIFDDPATGVTTALIAASDDKRAGLEPAVSAFGLKPVYLVRAKPEPKPAVVEPEKTGLTKGANLDSKAAATEVWDYFGNMPTEQRGEVMRELRRMFMENTTPEQLHEMMGGMGPGPGPGPGRP